MCSACCLLCAACLVLCVVCWALCAVRCVLCAVCCVLCTVCWALCAVCCVRCAVCRVLSAGRGPAPWLWDWRNQYWWLPKIMARFPEAEGFLWTNDDVIVNYWNFLKADKTKLWLPNDPSSSETRHFPYDDTVELQNTVSCRLRTQGMSCCLCTQGMSCCGCNLYCQRARLGVLRLSFRPAQSTCRQLMPQMPAEGAKPVSPIQALQCIGACHASLGIASAGAGDVSLLLQRPYTDGTQTDHWDTLLGLSRRRMRGLTRGEWQRRRTISWRTA